MSNIYASQKYFENGNFEKEPWRTRLVKDLDIAGRHSSFPRDVIYPLKNSSNVIAIALSIVIEYGDSQESTEMLLEGLESSVVPDQYEDGEEYVIYSLPIGYFRKIPVVKIQYQDGVVSLVLLPEWLIYS